MFFDDPVAAFANIGRAVRPGGRLRCLTWQAPAENDWVAVPAAIASRFVDLPAHNDGPGPFALSDADKVRRILTDAGWRVDEIDPTHGHLAVGGHSTYEDAIDFTLGGGPLKATLGDAGEEVLGRVRSALTEELASYYDGTELRMGYGAWLIEATRP
jgi:hypothetical protein